MLLVGLFLTAAILGVVSLCAKFLSRPIARLVDRLKSRLFFNGMIRFTLQSYLKFVFVVLAELKYFSKVDTQQRWFLLISPIVLVALPFLFGAIVYKKRCLLTLKTTQAQIGVLYIGIRHYKMMQIMHPSFFLLRRLAFALTLILLEDKPCLVVFLLLELNIIEVAYVCGTDPYNSFYEKRVYLMNQVFMQLALYHLLLNAF